MKARKLESWNVFTTSPGRPEPESYSRTVQSTASFVWCQHRPNYHNGRASTVALGLVSAAVRAGVGYRPSFLIKPLLRGLILDKDRCRQRKEIWRCE